MRERERSFRLNLSSGIRRLKVRFLLCRFFPYPPVRVLTGSIICLFRSMSATFLVTILFSSFFLVLKGRIGSRSLFQFLVECLWFTVLEKSKFL